MILPLAMPDGECGFILLLPMSHEQARNRPMQRSSKA
jgi:hypothetical protein